MCRRSTRPAILNLAPFWVCCNYNAHSPRKRRLLGKAVCEGVNFSGEGELVRGVWQKGQACVPCSAAGLVLRIVISLSLLLTHLLRWPDIRKHLNTQDLYRFWKPIIGCRSSICPFKIGGGWDLLHCRVEINGPFQISNPNSGLWLNEQVEEF